MTTEAPARFGLLLKRYRPAACLTQEMPAERARISKGGLQDLERDPRRRPRLNTAELLADALEEGITLARGMPYPYAEVRFLDLHGQLPAHSGAPAVVHPRQETR